MATMVERPSLKPAMEGITEDITLRNTNFLTLNRVYSKIGSTRLIASDPAVIHFGGFQLGQVYTQVIHVRNIGGTGTRIHIITPTTPFFTATCNAKRGLVAPGLDEEITVEFCPQQWRYYYDCIRIHSEDENLLIPIHGYPVMNEAKFPKRVDFGRCAIGAAAVRRVKLECKVPIEFEVELRELKANSVFSVHPMRAIVPAHGFVTFEITFLPTRLATEELLLEVRVAEFNSEPVICTIMGSAFPGVARDQLLAEAAGVPPSMLTMDHLDGTVALNSAGGGLGSTGAANKGGGNIRGGAGNGDAYTAFVTSERKAQQGSRDCRTAGPIKMRLPSLPTPSLSPVPPMETVVDGVYVPEGLLQTAADVAYVLNQQPGRLRTKDVKGAIAERKVEQATQQAALDEVLEQGLAEGGVHPMERPEVEPSIKAALFKSQLAAVEAAQRHASLGTCTSLGEVVLRWDEVERAQQQRAAHHLQQRRVGELADMTRLSPTMQPSGALHMPSTSGSGGGGSRGVTADDGLGNYAPQWRLVEANDFAKRALALRRFVSTARNIMYRYRLQKRLDRLNDVLTQLGRDKQRLAEEAANPVLLVSQEDRPGTAPTKHLRPENVRTRELPLYRDVHFNYHGPVPPSHYTDFDQLTEFQQQVPLQYRILGYTFEEFPGLTPYAPLQLDQPLMRGAVEETAASGGGTAAPSGLLPPPESLPAMPASCKSMPFVILEVANRYTEDKVQAPPEPSWGMDAAYLHQPRFYALHDSARHESTPSGSIRALRGAPLLCDSWLPRQDMWQVQLTPETVPPLMYSADPADGMSESPLDADKPRIAISVPTALDLQRFLPAAGVLPPTAAAVAVSVPQGSDAPAYQLLRQTRQSEMDSTKHSAQVDALNAYAVGLDTYNTQLSWPCYHALKPAT